MPLATIGPCSPLGAAIAITTWLLTSAAAQGPVPGPLPKPTCTKVLPFEKPCHVEFSPDGRLLAVVNGRPGYFHRNDSVVLWDLKAGKAIHSLSLKQMDSVLSLAFSPDGKNLAVGGNDRLKEGCPADIELWDVASGAQHATLTGCIRFPRSLAFSADSTHLLAPNGFDGINVYHVASGRLVRKLAGPHPDSRLAVSPEGNLCAAAGVAPEIWVGDFSRGQGGLTLLTLNVPKFWLNDLAFSPDGRRLLSCHGSHESRKDQKACLWDVRTGKLLATWARSDEEYPLFDRAFFSRAGDYAIVGHPAAIAAWDGHSDKPLWMLKTGLFKDKDSVYNSMAVSADGKWLATADWDKRRVKIWSLPTRSPK